MLSSSHFYSCFAFLLIIDKGIQENSTCDVDEESKLPLQLAIVGRPNVGKSTLLNTLLQENRVLVGPEAGLTRDSVRAQFQFQGRTIYLVNIKFSYFAYSSWISSHNETTSKSGITYLEYIEIPRCGSDSEHFLVDLLNVTF